MEKHPDPGIEMTVKFQLFFFAAGLLLACSQPGKGTNKNNDSILLDQNNAVITRVLSDSNIAILSNTRVRFFSLKDSLPAILTGNDIQLIEQLLMKSVQSHNRGADSNGVYSDYIHIGNYKRQYVAYTGVKGEKKVFINCFCKGLDNFDYWKERLVEIEDGGICFFNATVDLSNHIAGPVLINGPG